MFALGSTAQTQETWHSFATGRNMGGKGEGQRLLVPEAVSFLGKESFPKPGFDSLKAAHFNMVVKALYSSLHIDLSPALTQLLLGW